MRTFATPVRQRAASRTPAPGKRFPVPSRNCTSTVQRAAVRQILHGPCLQPKLTVGPPEDAYEREADRVADAVMRMPAPDKPIQRLCPECEEKPEPIQRKCGCLGEDLVQCSGVSPIDTLAGAESKIAAVRGGEPLSKSARAFFEPSLGHDLGGVRIHTDGQADAAATAVGARAYTLGNDIVFRKGEYNPDSPQGRRLLAHELVHVIQQGAASPGQAEGSSVRRLMREGVLQREKDEDGFETAPDPERVDTPRRVPDLSREEALRRGREALEVLGYEELIRRAVAAGLLRPAGAAEGGIQRSPDSDHLQRQDFGEVFTPFAVAAGVTSQVDTPAPGPADLVALGILAVGVIYALAVASSTTTTRRPCPPCPTPPAPQIDRVPPSRPHFPCPGDHWHYFVYNQNPITCQCFSRRMFGGCCGEGAPGAPC